MKKEILFVLFLLVAMTLPASADNYKGTIERHGGKVEYSLSGGKVTNKYATPYVGDVFQTMGVFIDGEVKAGSTLTASYRKLTGLKKDQEVTINVLIKDQNGQYRQQNKTGKGSASISVSVPNDAAEVSIKMSHKNGRTQLLCDVTWTVVRESTTRQPSSNNGGCSTVSSGTKFKDQVTSEGHTMKYSISGPTIRFKEAPNLVRGQMGHTDHHQTVKGYVKKGQTITVELEKVSGKDTPRLNISFDYLKEGAVPRFSNAARMIRTEQKDKISNSYTVPSNAEVVYVHIYYQVPHQGADSGIDITANLYVGDRVPDYALPSSSSSTPPPTTTSTPTPNFNWNDIAPDENCPKCKQPYSHYEIRSIQGTAAKRCKDGTGSYRELKGIDPLYFHDNIQTKAYDEVTLSYDDEEECLVIKENSSVLCERLTNGTDRWHVYKGKIVGKYLKHANTIKKPTFQMSNCTAYPKGTIFVLEDDGKTSRVYLLDGAMEVTSKKTSKKENLQPGQMSTVSSNGQQKVETFDVKAMAKKYGISLTGVSTPTTTPQPTTGNTGLVFTEDKLHYKILSDNTVEVTGDLRGTYKGSVKIPAQVKHQGKTYQVVGIGSNAFANQSQMTSVTIPTSVRSIASDAFANSGLTSVTVPGDKVSIAANAFRNCRQLLTATVSGKNPQCQGDAFTGCSSMKELRIRDIKESNYGKTLPGTTAVIKRL